MLCQMSCRIIGDSSTTGTQPLHLVVYWLAPSMKSRDLSWACRSEASPPPGSSTNLQQLSKTSMTFSRPRGHEAYTVSSQSACFCHAATKSYRSQPRLTVATARTCADIRDYCFIFLYMYHCYKCTFRERPKALLPAERYSNKHSASISLPSQDRLSSSQTASYFFTPSLFPTEKECVVLGFAVAEGAVLVFEICGLLVSVIDSFLNAFSFSYFNSGVRLPSSLTSA